MLNPSTPSILTGVFSCIQAGIISYSNRNDDPNYTPNYQKHLKSGSIVIPLILDEEIDSIRRKKIEYLHDLIERRKNELKRILNENFPKKNAIDVDLFLFFASETDKRFLEFGIKTDAHACVVDRAYASEFIDEINKKFPEMDILRCCDNDESLSKQLREMLLLTAKTPNSTLKMNLFTQRELEVLEAQKSLRHIGPAMAFRQQLLRNILIEYGVSAETATYEYRTSNQTLLPVTQIRLTRHAADILIAKSAPPSSGIFSSLRLLIE